MYNSFLAFWPIKITILSRTANDGASETDESLTVRTPQCLVYVGEEGGKGATIYDLWYCTAIENRLYTNALLSEIARCS